MKTMAGSRLEKRVGSIFIRVLDMKRAVEWYSRAATIIDETVFNCYTDAIC